MCVNMILLSLFFSSVPFFTFILFLAFCPFDLFLFLSKFLVQFWILKSGLAAQSRQTGWYPQHIIIRSADKTVLGCCPLYLKTHSYGEYVFDHSWANAAMYMGHRYYPKLQSCVPFTPVPGPRLLVKPGPLAREITEVLAKALKALAGEETCACMLRVWCACLVVCAVVTCRFVLLVSASQLASGLWSSEEPAKGAINGRLNSRVARWGVFCSRLFNSDCSVQSSGLCNCQSVYGKPFIDTIFDLGMSWYLPWIISKERLVNTESTSLNMRCAHNSHLGVVSCHVDCTRTKRQLGPLWFPSSRQTFDWSF